MKVSTCVFVSCLVAQVQYILVFTRICSPCVTSGRLRDRGCLGELAPRYLESLRIVPDPDQFLHVDHA